MAHTITITKANGEREPFDPNKLISSLKRSGATDSQARTVLEHIEGELHDGISTTIIYQNAHKKLKSLEQRTALRYSLKNAILEFGPTGFPFERFVAEIISRRGYETQVGSRLRGMCVEHEIDILAHHESHTFVIETKFHNEHGIKSDLKTALYVKARFDDLWESPHLGVGEKPHGSWLITNTKFTESAIQYGECAGMTMVGWNYPDYGNLQDLIEESGLHPITSLTTLNRSQKTRFLNDGLTLCRHLREKDHDLKKYGLSDKKSQDVVDEASLVCGI